MSKIIIPFKNIFKTEYDPFLGLITMVKPEIDYSQSSPFSKPENEYIIQPIWPDKRNYKTKSTQVSSQDIAKLKINPDSTVVINTDHTFDSLDIIKWHSSLHHQPLQNVFPVKKLSAYSPKAIKLSLTNIDKIPATIKEISLTSSTVEFQVSDLPHLEKITIKNHNFQNLEQLTNIQIDDCPNLKEIDLSEVKNNINYFFFTCINPDCIIKFDPKASILIQTSSSQIPFSKNYLNIYKAPESKVSEESGYYDPKALVLNSFKNSRTPTNDYRSSPAVSILELVGQKYLKNGIIEISAKDFVHGIVEFERKLYNKFFDNYDKITQHQLSDTKPQKQTKVNQKEKDKQK